MADLITGDTQLGATKAAVIAAMVQKELAFAAKLSPLVRDVSQYAVPGAKSVSFPKLSSFTIIDRASGVAGDASVLTSSVDTMLLDINAYCAWIIDSSDLIQSSIDAELEFAGRAAAAHGRYVDTKILAEMETVGVATTTAGVITRDIFLEMQQALLGRNANPDQMAFVCGVDSRSALLKITEFTQAQVYGSAVIPGGVIGSIYGTPVVVSNAISTANTYYMLDRDGIALGFQKNPSMSEQMANEFGTNAMRKAMDQLFGVKGQQLGVNGVLATESALVVKDNN